MKAFKKFQREDKSFWFFIRFISERLGYTDKKTKEVKKYTFAEVDNICKSENLNMKVNQIQQAIDYCDMRATAINTVIRPNLMNLQQVQLEYNRLFALGQYTKNFPMNKQRGAKKNVNFYAAIIIMLAETAAKAKNKDFDADPHGLVYFLNNQKIVGSSSRRLDGAYPSIYTPELVWEIKEYYYTTSFGSRIADAIYETQLDGYEFDEIYNRTGVKPHHVLFVDSQEWWNHGKSYLCRLIDALNQGLVDDVIFGREVFTEWPKILNDYM